MTHAYITYHDTYAHRQHGHIWHPVNSKIMGAFTTDLGIVQQLYALGVPVWFIRTDVSILDNTRVRALVRMTHPTQICTSTVGVEDGWILYKGLASPKHLAAMACGGHTYVNIPCAPLLAVKEYCRYLVPIANKQYTGYHSGGTESA